MKARLTIRTCAALACVLTTTLLGPAAPATPGPPPPSLGGLTMVWDLPIHYPRQVPLASSGQTTRISVVVTSNQPVTITARSDDDALSIVDAQRSFGALAEPTTVSFDVAALQPGFHPFWVQMDGSVGPPYYSVSVGYGYVWTTGSPLPVPPSASTGRHRVSAYGYQTPGSSPQILTFATKDLAHIGLPAFGQPTCTVEGGSCVRYWHDPGVLQTLQIGTSIVGAFHRGGLYTDGFVPAGPTTGTPFGTHDFIHPLSYVDPRNGIHGTFTPTDRSRTSGLVREKVALDKDGGSLVGDYRLSYSYAGQRKRTFEGTFRVEKGGAITFRDARGKVVQRGTLLSIGRALPCAAKQVCRTADAAGIEGDNSGIWLILSGRKGKHPDGNLLQRVR